MAKSDCTNILNLIPLYIDNMLSEEEHDIVCEHIAGCSDCRKEYEMMKSIMVSAGSLPEIDVPEGFHENLMEKIRVAAKDAPKRRTLIPWRRATGFVAAAAVVALSVVSYLSLDRNNGAANPDLYLPSPSTEQTIAPASEARQSDAENREETTAQNIGAQPERGETAKPPVVDTGNAKTEKPAVVSPESSFKDTQQDVKEETPLEANAAVPEVASLYTVEERESVAAGEAGTSDNTVGASSGGARIGGNATQENEIACRIVTVTVDADSRDQAEEILSVYSKDAQGYRVSDDLPALLEKLSSLTGYREETKTGSDITENYIILE